MAGTWIAPGKVSSTQLRHCAHACGWVPIRRISSGRVPGRTASWKTTCTCISATMTRGSPCERESNVALTPPSMEFSIGTTARSASPRRTAASACGALVIGMRIAPAGATWWTACSVNVPNGPRKAIRSLSPRGAGPGMFVVMVSRVTRAKGVARPRFEDRSALWPIARVPRPGGPHVGAPPTSRGTPQAAAPRKPTERQSRSPVTPVAKASRPPPGVTSPHAVIFHSFAVPPASTSSKPVDVSTPYRPGLRAERMKL